MIKLEKKDWEQAKREAEAMIRQNLILGMINTNLLETAEKELKKFPKDDEKRPLGV